MTGIPPDHSIRIHRLAGLIRRWTRGQAIPANEEKELCDALLQFVLESAFCRRRLRGLSRELGSQMETEGRSILGSIMARLPQNRLAIILGEIIDADDATLLAECRSRVRTAAGNEAFHQLQTTDPNGFKILKSLGDALHGRPDLFVLLPENGSATQVTVVRDGQLRSASPQATVDDLLRLLPAVCSQHQYMPSRVLELLSIIAEDDRWCAVVPIAALFDAFRFAIEAEILTGAETSSPPLDIPPLLKLALDSAARKSREEFQARLSRNVSDGHFTAEEAGAIIGSIEAIMEECVTTGRWPGEMKEYLRLQIPDLADEHYNRRYKARFQYLVDVAKKTFFTTLAREYGR
ncbi:MAG: hypothetical protein HZB43_04295 [candidate division Zixibacteria bacterium]|nr:hypothetical protein [candidate division Zixibacteria bacterium]